MTIYIIHFIVMNQIWKKEKDIFAPMYNEMIKQGKNITITQVPYDGVDVLGTPDELKASLKNK